MNSTNPALSARLFEAAFQSASVGMALVGQDGRFIRVNEAVCRIFEYSEAELIGSPFAAHTFPEDLITDRALMTRLLAGDIEHYEWEKRAIHRAGHVVRIQFSVALIRSESGQPELALAQINDIPPRKRLELALEKALRASEQLLASSDAAHANIRKLQKTLLTMCARTKRVQHEGRWISIDEFLSNHLSIQVSHGISEEGLAEMMAELGDLAREQRTI